MSENVQKVPDLALEIERLRQALAEKSNLVQNIREELIRSQVTVLELQDTVLQKETDKADAVAILGQAELVLEGKINYIFDLDRALNQRIKAAEEQLSQAQSAHETITSDLVRKVDETNRALGEAHNLAAGYAREAAEARESAAQKSSSIQQLQRELQEAQTQFSSLSSERAAIQTELTSTVQAKDALEQQLASIRSTFAWKITAPFRSSNDRQQ